MLQLKGHKVADWIKKQDLSIYMLLTRDSLRAKIRRWKKIFHENGHVKKAMVEILISDKVDFKIKYLQNTRKSTV